MSSYCWCQVSYRLYLPDPVSYVSECVYSFCVGFLKQTVWKHVHYNTRQCLHVSAQTEIRALHWCTITHTQTWTHVLCVALKAFSVSDEPWSGSFGSSAGAVWTSGHPTYYVYVCVRGQTKDQTLTQCRLCFLLQLHGIIYWEKLHKKISYHRLNIRSL